MTLKEATSWMKQPGIKAVTEGMDRHTSEAINTLIKASEELEVYKKALGMVCKDIAKSHPILSALGYDYYEDRYLRKARDEE